MQPWWRPPRGHYGGIGHPHHASHVGRGQPALLVVVGSRELPAFVLTILLVVLVVSSIVNSTDIDVDNDILMDEFSKNVLLV